MYTRGTRAGAGFFFSVSVFPLFADFYSNDNNIFNIIFLFSLSLKHAPTSATRGDV